jgi:mRNA interferase YafQ
MTKLVVSSKFKRAFRKFTRRNPQLQIKVEETLMRMSQNLDDDSLGTHKLTGKLSDLLSCSCGYDCRVVFAMGTETDNEGKSTTVIVLLDVGTHDDVY